MAKPTKRSVCQSMSLKLPMAVAVTIFATAPIVVFAEQSNAGPWKPTIEDVQKFVDAIGGDEDKLKTYCEINKTHEALDKAEEAGDAKAFDVGAPNLTVSNRKWGLITLG